MAEKETVERTGADRIGVVCFSGGKDSTAMLIRMLEIDDPVQYPIKRVIFADTEFEFPELYAYLDEVQKYLDDNHAHWNLTIERLKPVKTWNDNFYGRMVRGKYEGQYRAAPFQAYPCYHARDSKVKPIQRATKDADVVYVGIAADESHRATNNPKSGTMKNRYPLVDWGWSEDDCFEYLDKLSIVNVLYQDFNRLGCYHCIKQPMDSWHSLWKKYPDLYALAKEWDNEARRLTQGSRGLRQDYSIQELQDKFEDGFVPKKKKTYECNSCVAVGAVEKGHITMEDFETDEAPEHDPAIAAMMAKAEGLVPSDDDWEAPACEIPTPDEPENCDGILGGGDFDDDDL